MKYLLCRPRGGLNDTLCQIEFCWHYAELHNRLLIIDTEYLVTCGISVRFSKLFEPVSLNPNILFNLPPTLLDYLNTCDTFPPSCTGRLDKYQSRYEDGVNNFIDTNFGTQLTFDFKKNYVERLLVHDQCGGGDYGISCLARLKLADNFKSQILDLLLPLAGKNYLAIHVRNTDYNTDYKRFFEEIYTQSIGQILLLCTDSAEVQSYAKVFFNESELITLCSPPETSGVGLATFATLHCNDAQRYELMIKAISDLIGMASASELIFGRLMPKSPQGESSGIGGFSGFAVLIDCLRNNPLIINQLLGR